MKYKLGDIVQTEFGGLGSISDVDEINGIYSVLLADGVESVFSEDELKPTEKMNSYEYKQSAIDRRYLRMAFIWSENSYAQRRQVGCLIVKDHMIISDGYNGTPSGFQNVCEDASNKTYPYVLHAEANAITKLAKHGNKSDGATLYCTDEPCMECSKLIIQAGIKRVVYCREYRLHEGLDLLREANIKVEQIKPYII